MKQLDVRDMYAMAALQGLLASKTSGINPYYAVAKRVPDAEDERDHNLNVDMTAKRMKEIAAASVMIADEMMKLREEPK